MGDTRTSRVGCITSYLYVSAEMQYSREQIKYVIVITINKEEKWIFIFYKTTY